MTSGCQYRSGIGNLKHTSSHDIMGSPTTPLILISANEASLGVNLGGSIEEGSWGTHDDMSEHIYIYTYIHTLSLCLCIFMHLCRRRYVYIYIYTHISTCICTFVFRCIFMSIYVFLHYEGPRYRPHASFAGASFRGGGGHLAQPMASSFIAAARAQQKVWYSKV